MSSLESGWVTIDEYQFNRILFIGQAGTGKTTAINSLLGSNVGITGIQGTTHKPTQFLVFDNTLIDFPGFKSSTLSQEIQSYAIKNDDRVLLFCNPGSKVHPLDAEAIKILVGIQEINLTIVVNKCDTLEKAVEREETLELYRSYFSFVGKSYLASLDRIILFSSHRRAEADFEKMVNIIRNKAEPYSMPKCQTRDCQGHLGKPEGSRMGALLTLFPSVPNIYSGISEGNFCNALSNVSSSLGLLFYKLSNDRAMFVLVCSQCESIYMGCPTCKQFNNYGDRPPRVGTRILCSHCEQWAIVPSIYLAPTLQ